MMQRLPADFTQDLYGSKMLKEFGNTVKEAEVESYYGDYYTYTSIFKIRTIKKCFEDNDCKTDGLLEFNYRGMTFYGIQETKFRTAFTELQLKKQLVQSLMYEWMMEMRHFDYNMQIHILNSEKYFSYVYTDEIKEFRRKLWNIYPIIKETPCVAYKNPLVRNVMDETHINFHKELITDKFKLHEVVRNIFKHCL